MPELISPEKTATSIPLRKLNSTTASLLAFSGNSSPLDLPAMPTNTIPHTETSAAATDTTPAGVVNMAWAASLPFSSGGISVPAAEEGVYLKPEMGAIVAFLKGPAEPR